MFRSNNCEKTTENEIRIEIKLWTFCEVMQRANMKLILFTISIFVLGCSAAPSTSVNQFQLIQQKVEQLERSNKESIAVIAALKQTYDEKIASLEQQLRSERTLVLQPGRDSIFYIFLSDISVPEY